MQSNVFSAVCGFLFCCTMTSLAMTSNELFMKTNSSGTPVCTTDSPSQVMSMYPGGETRCGIECLVSPVCTYFQFKSAATPEQCQLYYQPPVTFTSIDRCIGYAVGPSCPVGWTQRGKRCYKLAVGQFQSWYQAENYCTQINAPQQPHLVNIESADEQLLVTELISELISVIPMTYSANVNLALYQPTSQSSTSHQSSAAVDGNNWSKFSGGSCSHTSNDPSPWLAVDLGKPTHVYMAAVTNRADINTANREDNFIDGLTNNPPRTMAPTTYGYTKCGQWPGSAPSGATMFVKCVDNLPPARYVVIIQQSQPLGYLQICELEVYGKGLPTTYSVNLALNQPTWQSSTYLNYQSQTAVDGNKNPLLSANSCAQTNNDSAPWLAVDLGKPTDVYGVAVTNRGDGNAAREDNFTVGLTNNPPSTMAPTTYGYTKCGQWPGPAPASATMFGKCVDNLPPARYVIIIQNSQPLGYLTICELEVYGKAYVWLNGGRLSPTSPFVWNPNQPSSKPLTYTNWASGFPAINSSSCLAMDVSNSSWLDTQCVSPNGTALYAICETPST